jgi:hypothetical protein
VWPQCWDLQGPRGLEQGDLRNLNLGDLKKGPNGGVSPTPHTKKVSMCMEATVVATANLTIYDWDTQQDAHCEDEPYKITLVVCRTTVPFLTDCGVDSDGTAGGLTRLALRCIS